MFRKLKNTFYRSLARFLQRVLDQTHAWGIVQKRLAELKGSQKEIATWQKQLAGKQSAAEMQMASGLNRIEVGQSRLEAADSRVFATVSQLTEINGEVSAQMQDLFRSQKQSLGRSILHSRFGSPQRGINGRSVVFVGQSYYHFYHLARALRARGWDAMLVSDHVPAETWTKYFHGQDVHLWHEDPEVFDAMRRSLFDIALGRFQMAHFAGDGMLAFHPSGYVQAAPPDMAQWQDHGKFVAFTVSGCNTGISKVSMARWSGTGGVEVCSRCRWNDVPEVCSPERSLAFGEKLLHHCSLICAEGLPRLDFMDNPRSVFDPLSVCVNSSMWSPQIAVPEEFREDNPAGDVLVYHGVGEYEARTTGSKNIKGTSAIVAAIERLQKDGHGVRMMFTTGVKNVHVRYRQVQADIIVDQLNLGRYGAQAREGMMLGKPVICQINKTELAGEPLAIWDECPIVPANEDTLYEKLKELVLDKAKRLEIGKMSREYALKWHSPEACAVRYETIYDALVAGVSDFGPITRSAEWRNAHLSR